MNFQRMLVFRFLIIIKLNWSLFIVHATHIIQSKHVEKFIESNYVEQNHLKSIGENNFFHQHGKGISLIYRSKYVEC